MRTFLAGIQLVYECVHASWAELPEMARCRRVVLVGPASRVALLPWVSGSGPPSVCDDDCLSIEVLQVRCVFACVSLKRAHHPASRQRRTSAEHLAALERPACLQTIAGLCQTSTSQSALAGHGYATTKEAKGVCEQVESDPVRLVEDSRWSLLAGQEIRSGLAWIKDVTSLGEHPLLTSYSRNGTACCHEVLAYQEPSIPLTLLATHQLSSNAA